MTEEEKAATRSCCLSSLKDLITIRARIERLLDLIEVDVVHGTHALEDTRREGRDLGPR